MKQFYALCDARLFASGFPGYTRIEVEDLCEAWYSLYNLERETITRTSAKDIATLQAIKELREEYDKEFETRKERAVDTATTDKPYSLWEEPRRPIKADIARRIASVSDAQFFRLLAPRGEGNIQGELLELNYVRGEMNDDGRYVFELTPLGRSVLEGVPSEVTVNGTTYEPIEPLEVPDFVLRQFSRSNSQGDENCDE